MVNLLEESPKLLVVGDLIIDHYLWGNCDRISPEAPVQVIDVYEENLVLGGAGNVINNLKTLGAEVDIISVIGDCEVSIEARELLEDIGIDTRFLATEVGRMTSKKSRIISSQQQVVRFDREKTKEINIITHKTILECLENIIDKYDVILISDYGKGLMTHKLTQSIINCANSHNIKVLVDPKGRNYSKYKGAFLLTPNKKEASEATNIDINDDESLKIAISKLKNDCNLEISLITLSENGVAVFDGTLKKYPTVAREVFDVTGAGDTMLASLGFAISSKLDIDEAVKFANLAAGVSVGKIGNSTVSINEIIEYESSINKSHSDTHIKDINEISLLSKELKARGKKIIFTNGCFDLLHAGHIRYLEKAKEFGDILIVGLNSNNSVKSLKGDDRPINDEYDRAYILAALESVDYVVIFDEENPYDLIKFIQPNVLVKGGDYKGKKVVGHDLVDELRIVDFIEGKSSTITIEKIKNGK